MYKTTQDRAKQDIPLGHTAAALRNGCLAAHIMHNSKANPLNGTGKATPVASTHREASHDRSSHPHETKCDDLVLEFADMHNNEHQPKWLKFQ